MCRKFRRQAIDGTSLSCTVFNLYKLEQIKLIMRNEYCPSAIEDGMHWDAGEGERRAERTHTHSKLLEHRLGKKALQAA